MTVSSQHSNSVASSLALFPIAQLARDGNTEPDPGSGGIRFTAEEVDQLTEQIA